MGVSVSMVNISNINELIQNAQIGQEFQFWAYGDRIFNEAQYIRAAARAGRNMQVPPAMREDEQILKPLRSMGAEAPFGKILNNFRYCKYDEAQKVLLCPVAKHYLNIVFITNCHTCLYGSETSTYFNLIPPVLENF